MPDHEHEDGLGSTDRSIRAMRRALLAHERAIGIHESAARLFRLHGRENLADAEVAAAAIERDRRDHAKLALAQLEAAG
jgi:hypothetical protein